MTEISGETVPWLSSHLDSPDIWTWNGQDCMVGHKQIVVVTYALHGVVCVVLDRMGNLNEELVDVSDCFRPLGEAYWDLYMGLSLIA